MLILDSDNVHLHKKVFNALFFCAFDSLENELESLRDALMKAKLDSSSPQTTAKSPSKLHLHVFDTSIIKNIYSLYKLPHVCFFPVSKISPVKQSQLRNFLSKGQMPPVRSTAPGMYGLISTYLLYPEVGIVTFSCVYVCFDLTVLYLFSCSQPVSFSLPFA